MTCTSRTDNDALGEPVGLGKGVIVRMAIMQASVKAQLVKNPKVVWRRFRALCILVHEARTANGEVEREGSTAIEVAQP